MHTHYYTRTERRDNHGLVHVEATYELSWLGVERTVGCFSRLSFTIFELTFFLEPGLSKERLKVETRYIPCQVCLLSKFLLLLTWVGCLEIEQEQNYSTIRSRRRQRYSIILAL